MQVIEEGAKKPSKRVVQRFGEAGADTVRVALDGNGGCRPQVLPVTAGVIEIRGETGSFFFQYPASTVICCRIYVATAGGSVLSLGVRIESMCPPRWTRKGFVGSM